MHFVSFSLHICLFCTIVSVYIIAINIILYFTYINRSYRLMPQFNQSNCNVHVYI